MQFGLKTDVACMDDRRKFSTVTSSFIFLPLLYHFHITYPVYLISASFARSASWTVIARLCGGFFE